MPSKSKSVEISTMTEISGRKIFRMIGGLVKVFETIFGIFISLEHFLESGVEVIGREQIRNTIPEAVALAAIKGNTEDIRNIGLKAGADVVIVGTTISKLKINKQTGIKMVQVNISAKAVSIVDSFLIAAKSDFAIVKSEYELLAELEAFDTTSQKLADFLLPSLYRYWEKGVQASDQKVKNAPPIPMADM